MIVLTATSATTWVSPDERIGRQRSPRLSVFVLLTLSVASSAGLCLTADAATHSSVRLHLPIERSRRVTGLSLADSATRHDRNGPASFPPASRRRRSQRGCVQPHPSNGLLTPSPGFRITWDYCGEGSRNRNFAP